MLLRTRVSAVACLMVLTVAAASAGAVAKPAGTPAPGKAAGPCGASASHPGGDWPSYGHDLANTRSQPREKRLGADNADALQVAWVFNANSDGGGTLNSTPVVADGCVYLAASA